VGPKLTRSGNQAGPLWSKALMTTPCSSSNASRPGSAKTGRCVRNVIEVRGVGRSEGRGAGALAFGVGAASGG
jgi:hypothetical protein